MNIPFTENDCQELMNGEVFNWTFETDEGVSTDVQLYNEDLYPRCDVCEEAEDPDGNCGCTNDDTK